MYRSHFGSRRKFLESIWVNRIHRGIMPQIISRRAMFRPYPPGSPDQWNKVAGTVYAIAPNGQVQFVFLRKVPPNGRKDMRGRHAGAAGTPVKYHGLWCGPGGTPERCKHPLAAFMAEFRDETGYAFDYRHVDIEGKPRGAVFTVVHYDILPGVDYFIIEMRWDEFSSSFPPNFVHNPRLIRSSHGEIDSVRRLSTQDIFDFQTYEVDTKGNNYFASYVLKTFFEIVMPFLCDFYPAYGRRWANVQPPPILRDTHPRFASSTKA